MSAFGGKADIPDTRYSQGRVQSDGNGGTPPLLDDDLSA
jgi:hypothetical protein